MSSSYIFIWALAVYVAAVFIAAFALLRMRRENQSLQERVRELEARLRSRAGVPPGGSEGDTGAGPHGASSSGRSDEADE